MTRFLNLASKALAVVGVLTLMWTAGGMQSAKADDYADKTPPGAFNCYHDAGPGNTNLCGGWWCGAWFVVCRTDNPPLPPVSEGGAWRCCV